MDCVNIQDLKKSSRGSRVVGDTTGTVPVPIYHRLIIITFMFYADWLVDKISRVWGIGIEAVFFSGKRVPGTTTTERTGPPLFCNCPLGVCGFGCKCTCTVCVCVCGGGYAVITQK